MTVLMFTFGILISFVCGALAGLYGSYYLEND